MKFLLAFMKAYSQSLLTSRKAGKRNPQTSPSGRQITQREALHWRKLKSAEDPGTLPASEVSKQKEIQPGHMFGSYQQGFPKAKGARSCLDHHAHLQLCSLPLHPCRAVREIIPNADVPVPLSYLSSGHFSDISGCPGHCLSSYS